MERWASLALLALGCGGKSVADGQDATSPFVPFACIAGAPVAIAALDPLTADIVADEGYVYWAHAKDPTAHIVVVHRVAKAGGPTEELAMIDVVYANTDVGIALTSKDVVLVTYGRAGEFHRVPKSGGSPVKLASTPAIDSTFLIADETNAYSGEWSVPLDGSPPHQLAMVSMPGSVMVFAGGVDAQRLYGSVPFGSLSSLISIELGSNALTKLAVGGWPVIVDSSFLYFSEWRSGLPTGIARVGTDGTDYQRLSDGEALGVMHTLAVDDEFVYWFESSSRAIWKVPKAGGVKARAVMGEVTGAFAVDASCLFWMDRSTIMRVAK